MRSFPILLVLAVSNVVRSAPVDRKSLTRPASSSQPRVGRKLPTKARPLKRALLRVCTNALDPNEKCDDDRVEDVPFYSRSLVAAQLGAFEPRAIQVDATILGTQSNHDHSEDSSPVDAHNGESSSGQGTALLGLGNHPIADVTAILGGGSSSSDASSSSSSSSSGDGSFRDRPVFAGHYPSSDHPDGGPAHGRSRPDNSQPARPRPDSSRPHSSSADTSQPDCDDGDQSYNPDNRPVFAGHVNPGHAGPSHHAIVAASPPPPKLSSKPRPLSPKLEPSAPASDCGCTKH